MLIKSCWPTRRRAPASESALWFDYGPDYYAAVSWSDIPKSDGRRLWLGWMSNWQYGEDVPTSPWRSAMSIPREAGLRQTAEGIRLVQKPAREMESLRDQHFEFKGGDIAEANAWLAKNQIQGDQLELAVEFDPQSTGRGRRKGFERCQGGDGDRGGSRTREPCSWIARTRAT